MSEMAGTFNFNNTESKMQKPTSTVGLTSSKDNIHVSKISSSLAECIIHDSKEEQEQAFIEKVYAICAMNKPRDLIQEDPVPIGTISTIKVAMRDETGLFHHVEKTVITVCPREQFKKCIPHSANENYQDMDVEFALDLASGDFFKAAQVIRQMKVNRAKRDKNLLNSTVSS